MSEIRTRLQGDTPFFPNMLNNGSVEVCLKEDVDKVLAEKDKEIAELKAKLENVQASMYADVVDANMEVRKLKRALYKACANWAHATIYYSGVHESDEFKWENMETECLKKAEEYK